MSQPASAAPAERKIDYAKDVQPIFNESCVRCHKAPDGNGPGNGPGRGPGGQGGPGGPGGRRGPGGGLRLDDKAALMAGGKHGKSVVPGKAEQSLLYKVLKGSANVDGDEIHLMPKPKPREQAKPLANGQIETIKLWIDQGAQ